MKNGVFGILLAAAFASSGTAALAEQTLAGSFNVSAPPIGATWSDEISARFAKHDCTQHEKVTSSFDAKTKANYATYSVGTDAGPVFDSCNTSDSVFTLHFTSATSGGNDVAYVKFVSGSTGSNDWKATSDSKAYGDYTLSLKAGIGCGADDCYDIYIGHK